MDKSSHEKLILIERFKLLSLQTTYELKLRISPQKQERQFWKHDNHPFYLYSNKMIQQKVDYIHFNPVEAGFVNEPHEWRLSSANSNSPIKTEETSVRFSF